MGIMEQLDREIVVLQERKKEIRSKCSHPDISSVNRVIDGNPEVGRDASYWSEHTCNLCGHEWTTKR